MQGMLRAVLYTLAAVQAFFFILKDLHPGALALGVGTPLAAKRTALEKDGGANAGPVMDGELLNIKYDSCLCHFLLLLQGKVLFMTFRN